MIKRWRRTVKLLATSLVIAGYVTVGLLVSDIATLRGGAGGRGGKSPSRRDAGDAPQTGTSDATVKTVVGYSMEFRLQEEMMMTEEIRCDGGDAPTDSDDVGDAGWTRDDNLRLFLYSAHYDTRLEPHDYVRVVALAPRNVSLYCQVWYDKDRTLVTRKAVIREIWSTNWGHEDTACDKVYPSLISCPIPLRDEYRGRVPVRVSFVDKFCNRSAATIVVNPPAPVTTRDSYVVCVKPLNYTDHINDESLTEWIELNVRLGAGKIVAYVTRLHPVDVAVLRRYRENGVVEVRPFRPPVESPSCTSRRTYEDHLWQKRKMEVIAYNDCFYRNLRTAKFVLPLDIDEIIVPKVGDKWSEAFAAHFGQGWPSTADKYSSFSARNVYFFARIPTPWDATLPGGGNASERTKLVTALEKQRKLGPRDSIFRRNVRSSDFSPATDSIKSFVHVSNTLTVFNHYAFHVLGDVTRQYLLPGDVMQLNHYRTECDPLLIDGCHKFLSRLTVDDSLERFRNRIRFVKPELINI